VNELSNADRRGIAVAADTQGTIGMIAQHGTGGDRRHTAVHRIETV
jgi:hypothetical protein